MDHERADNGRPIGELFVERGFVTEEQLRTALDQQHAMGGQLLGEILVERGLVSRLDLANVLGEQFAAKRRRMTLVRDAEAQGAHTAAPAVEGLDELPSVVGELREWLAAARAEPASESSGLGAMLDERFRIVVDELSGRLELLRPIERRAPDAELTALHETLETLRTELRAAIAQEPAERSALDARLLDPITRRLDGFDERLSEIGRAELPSVVGELREWLAAARAEPARESSGLGAMLDERFRALVGELSGRLDVLGPIEHRAPDAELIAVRETLETLHAELRSAIALEPAPIEVDALARDIVNGLHGRLEERLATLTAANGGAIQAELSALESRLLDAITRRLDGLDERLSEIRAARDPRAPDEIAGALAAVGLRMDALELHAGEASSELLQTLHQVLTDLRGELAARDERLRQELQAASEDAAQTVIPERGGEGDRIQPVPDETPPQREESHVAFVRTGTGYELVELEGAAAPVGAEVEAATLDGRFVVAAIGPSPFPLDRRRCAYLEPLHAWSTRSP